MTIPMPPSKDMDTNNEVYLKIWEIEQQHSTTRWTIATFFFNVSFAVFGLSFTLNSPDLTSYRHALWLAALAIYLFALMLLERFSQFSGVLRNYLSDMENHHQTTIDIQTRAYKVMGRKPKRRGETEEKQFRVSWLNDRYLFRYFGVLYIVAVVLLWMFLKP